MDLAKFATLPPENNNGSFLKFTAKDNVKIVRFCYNSPEDIQVRRKFYDATTNKVVWDTPEGKWTMSLKVAVYSDKNSFETMTWDRSARFGADVLLPVFEAAGGKIIDTVYKVTCTKAGTIDATYSLFPMKSSEDYAMPDLATNNNGSFINSADDEGDVPTQADEMPVRKPAPQPTQQATRPTQTQQQSKSTVQPTVTSEVPKRKRNFWEEE